MPVATSTAIAVGGSSQAAAAAASAAVHQVHVDSCKASMPNFNPKTATVAEMREYGSCVDVLYPSQPGGGAVIGIKVALIVALIGLIFGMWYEGRASRWKRWGDIWVDVVLTGLVFALVSVSFLLATICMMYGIWWLFTA